MVEPVGLEPTMPGAADLQSAGVTNFPTTPLQLLYTLQLRMSIAVQAIRKVCIKMLSAMRLDIRQRDE